MPNDTEDDAHWLSTTDAAARLGVSPRAVQKRAERGTLTARRVQHGRAVRWEIDARELDANTDANSSQGVRKMDAKRSPPERDSVRQMDANGSPDVRPIDADFHAHLIEENKFLRATVEQLQRDGAETRAALRVALKAAPKQLTEGTDERAQSLQTNAREDAVDTDTGNATNGPQSATQSKARGSERRENKLRSIARLIFPRRSSR